MVGIERGPAVIAAIEMDVEAVPDHVHGPRRIQGGDLLHATDHVGHRPRGPAVGHDPARWISNAQSSDCVPCRVYSNSRRSGRSLRGAVREAPRQRLHARLLIDREGIKKVRLA